MLTYPILAASLVFAGASSASDAASGAHLAKAPAKAFPSGSWEDHGRLAKQPGRGRQSPPASLKAAAGSDDEGDITLPSPQKVRRESAYVCPSDMVMIGRSYCIDTYEASLVEVGKDGAETPWPFFQVLPAEARVRAVSQQGVFPQGYISGVQARAACEASGKRLCKPDEWKNACMGPSKTMFPYGNTRETGRCNDDGRSSMHFFNASLDDKPEHRWMWGFGGNMLDPRLNQLEGTLTRTGERSGCTNAYGVFDMVGNLHEWVDDPDGTFQGGYYLDTHLNGDGCYYRTTAHPMSHLDYSTGFRCCEDVADL